VLFVERVYVVTYIIFLVVNIDIQLATTTSKAYSGKKLIIQHSLLIQTSKTTLKNLFRFDFLKLSVKLRSIYALLESLGQCKNISMSFYTDSKQLVFH